MSPGGRKAHQRWNPGEQENLKGGQEQNNLGIKSNDWNWLNQNIIKSLRLIYSLKKKGKEKSKVTKTQLTVDICPEVTRAPNGGNN